MIEHMDGVVSPLMEALADLGTAMAHVQKIASEAMWREPQSELVGALRLSHRANAMGASLQLRISRELDVRSVPAQLGAVNLRAFLGHALTMSPGLAREQAKLSEELASKFPDTGTALAIGDISYEQAKAIVETVNGLPKCATTEQRRAAEAYLLEKADVGRVRWSVCGSDVTALECLF